MPMDPAQMAGGAPPQGMPPGMSSGPPQGGMPPQPQQTMTSPNAPPPQAQMGDDLPKVKEALATIIPQCIDQQRIFDIDKLIQVWPSVAQQYNLNIPFQTVWKIIEQDPDFVESILIQHGSTGIKANGQVYTIEQLEGMSNGAVPPQAQGGA